ncbi:MAG: histidine triad nucleotide-binding protein [Clostridia bacterium]|nr:histidine triad nucleotide-binding protein [Clostridia bacterium]
MDCIFCKIAEGTIPSKQLYENEYCLAFHDINPQTPVHILVIPKLHIGSADEVTEKNSVYLQKIFEAIPQIAKQAGLTGGYRVITNCGEDGCQSVKHLHFHILGGKKLPENMG